MSELLNTLFSSSPSRKDDITNARFVTTWGETSGKAMEGMVSLIKIGAIGIPSDQIKRIIYSYLIHKYCQFTIEVVVENSFPINKLAQIMIYGDNLCCCQLLL